MIVKFNNVEVPIYKLRLGSVVEYDNEFYHIYGFVHTRDGRFILDIRNYWNSYEVAPVHLKWAEEV
jgi:hypothetical protein